MSNALSSHWQFTTIAIKDDLGEQVGTGVLVGKTNVDQNTRGFLRSTWSGPASPVYLVTARHVLGANDSEIRETVHYSFRYNAVGPQGLEPRQSRFAISNDPPNWATHPDPLVDVAAMDVTSWVAKQCRMG